MTFIQRGLSHKYKNQHCCHTERSEVSINIIDLQGRGLASLNRKNDFFTSFRMTTYYTAPSEYFKQETLQLTNTKLQTTKENQ